MVAQGDIPPVSSSSKHLITSRMQAGDGNGTRTEQSDNAGEVAEDNREIGGTMASIYVGIDLDSDQPDSRFMKFFSRWSGFNLIAGLFGSKTKPSSNQKQD